MEASKQINQEVNGRRDFHLKAAAIAIEKEEK